MTKRSSTIASALAAGLLMAMSSTAMASSHREAPGIADDPAADNTDLYAWVEGSDLIVLANYIPLEEPAGGPNFHKFSDDVLYEVHIVRGPTSLADKLVYQIRFKTETLPYHDPANADATPAGGNEFFSQIAGTGPYVKQSYSVTKLEAGKNPKLLINDGQAAPPNIGPRTNALVYGNPSYEAFAMGFVKSLGGTEGQIFAGPRDDGFYVDLGGVFDLAGLRIGASLLNPGPAVDNVAGYNTHTIALKIPLTVANGGALTSPGTPNNANTIGVWASASRRKVSVLRKDGTVDDYGPWRQVSRLGLPLINEAVIGLQDKDAWNRAKPSDDLTDYGAYFLNPILVRNAKFAGLYGAGGPLQACSANGGDDLATGRADVIDVINLKNIPTANAHSISSIGDVLRVDLGIASGFPNGRAISAGTDHEQADVTDVALSLLLCKLAAPVPDGVSKNDATFKATFPFLAAPWEGFSQGHGKVQD